MNENEKVKLNQINNVDRFRISITRNSGQENSGVEHNICNQFQ
jgi:hypothetical protein